MEKETKEQKKEFDLLEYIGQNGVYQVSWELELIYFSSSLHVGSYTKVVFFTIYKSNWQVDLKIHCIVLHELRQLTVMFNNTTTFFQSHKTNAGRLHTNTIR